MTYFTAQRIKFRLLVAAAIVAVSAIFMLAFAYYGAIAYVVIHFIKKYW